MARDPGLTTLSAVDVPEPWIEQIIREAAEAGEFDGMPGTGRPLDDLERPYEPDWWVRRWFARERAAAERGNQKD